MTTGTLWRNRKERRDWARRLRSEDPGLEVVHAHAAGIDVGNSAHYVAVRPDRDPEPVRRFECFTADLYRLAEWLEGCGVKTVAIAYASHCTSRRDSSCMLPSLSELIGRATSPTPRQ
jgi:hypothetical protein